MQLKDRLPDLYGQQVKIGGAAGFIYCGDAFDGLEKLIDEIGRDEKKRLDKIAAEAETNYKNRDALFVLRKTQTMQRLKYEQKRIEYIDYMYAYKDSEISNCIYWLRTERAPYWQRYFMNRKNEAKKTRDELQSQRRGAERTLRRNQIILKGLEGAAAKKNWDTRLRDKMETAVSERDAFTVLSEADVIEEYPIILYAGVILIIKSQITGRYRDKQECDADINFQWRVDRARKSGWYI